MDELTQVYSLQFIHVIECKVVLNCKFSIATTNDNSYHSEVNSDANKSNIERYKRFL